MNKTPKVLHHRNLPLLLLQTREQVFARFRPILKEAKLSEQHWRIVRALLEVGPMEPREICEVCCLSAPSLAGILARMDDLGLVKRTRFANDQRRVQVTVTAKSVKLAEKLAPQIEQAYQALKLEIGTELFEQLHQTLDSTLTGLTADDGQQ